MWKVKRMNTERIVVLTFDVGAGGIAAHPATGSDRSLLPTDNIHAAYGSVSRPAAIPT